MPPGLRFQMRLPAVCMAMSCALAASVPAVLFRGPDELRTSECGDEARLIVTREGDTNRTDALTVVAVSGTALEGEDFPPLTTNLVFLPGMRTAELVIPVVADDTAEPTERFSLRIEGAGVPYVSANPLPVVLSNNFCSIRFLTDRVDLDEARTREADLSGWPAQPLAVGLQVLGSFNYRVVRTEVTARAGRDYVALGGTNMNSVLLSPVDNTTADGDRILRLGLDVSGHGVRILEPSSVEVVIHDDGDSAAGAARGLGRGSAQPSTVRMLAGVLPYTDGGWLMLGDFTTVDGLAQPQLARLTRDGRAAPGFTPPDPTLATITCAAVQADGGILIGGDFDTNRVPIARGVLRLLPDGTRDPGVALGSPFESQHSGARSVALAVDADGLVIVHWVSPTGEFTTRSTLSGAQLSSWSPPEGVTQATASGRFNQQQLIPEPSGTILALLPGGIFRLYPGGVLRASPANLLLPFPSMPVAASVGGGAAVVPQTWVSSGIGIARYAEDGTILGTVTTARIEGRNYPVTDVDAMLGLASGHVFVSARSGTNLLGILYDSDGNTIAGHVHSATYAAPVARMLRPVENASGELAVTLDSFAMPYLRWLRLDSTAAPVRDIAFRNIAIAPDGRIATSLTGQAPMGYRLEHSANLRDWTPLLERDEINWDQSPLLPGTTADAARRFYRARTR